METFAAGVAEPRPIRDVERLHADLQVRVPRNLDLTEHAEIPGRDAGSAQAVERRGAEAGLGHGLEGERIEVRVVAADAAEDLDVGLDLVGALSRSPAR